MQTLKTLTRLLSTLTIASIALAASPSVSAETTVESGGTISWFESGDPERPFDNCAPGTKRALQPGQSLSEIALICWGDAQLWPFIYIYTNTVHPGRLQDPNWVPVHTMVLVPALPCLTCKDAETKKIIREARLLSQDVQVSYRLSQPVLVADIMESGIALVMAPASNPTPRVRTHVYGTAPKPLIPFLTGEDLVDDPSTAVAVTAAPSLDKSGFTEASSRPYEGRIYEEIAVELTSEADHVDVTERNALLRLAEEFRCRSRDPLGCNQHRDDFLFFTAPRIQELMRIERILSTRTRKLPMGNRLDLLSRRERLLREIGGDGTILHPDAGTRSPITTGLTALQR